MAQLDPNRGAFRWAFHQAHKHLTGLIIVGIGFPVATSGLSLVVHHPKNPSPGQLTIEGVISAAIAFGGLAILVFLVMLGLALYQQRNALRSLLKDEIVRRKALENLPVSSEHAQDLRNILVQVETRVGNGQSSGAANPDPDVDSLRAHLPALQDNLDAWDASVAEVITARAALAERVSIELASGQFQEPYWNPSQLRELLTAFLVQRAVCGNLGTPTIKWDLFSGAWYWENSGLPSQFSQPILDATDEAGAIARRTSFERLVCEGLTWAETVKLSECTQTNSQLANATLAALREGAVGTFRGACRACS